MLCTPIHAPACCCACYRRVRSTPQAVDAQARVEQVRNVITMCFCPGAGDQDAASVALCQKGDRQASWRPEAGSRDRRLHIAAAHIRDCGTTMLQVDFTSMLLQFAKVYLWMERSSNLLTSLASSLFLAYARPSSSWTTRDSACSRYASPSWAPVAAWASRWKSRRGKRWRRARRRPHDLCTSAGVCC